MLVHQRRRTRQRRPPQPPARLPAERRGRRHVAGEPENRPRPPRRPSGTPITITAGDRTFTATLNDSEVSQDFIETLPVTLPWYRNYDIEFITELDAPMTETGPFYTDVQPGDLVYYNPMDSITIIYEETSSVPTLTKMGEITSDLTAFREPARQRRDADRTRVARHDRICRDACLARVDEDRSPRQHRGPQRRQHRGNAYGHP